MKDSKKSARRGETASGAAPPKQERAVLTRRQMIQAAREVFATSGFEHTSIEDIADRAGKTRGAFYSNFADKEDVFFAIFEEDLARSQQEINPRLREASTTGQRAEALVDHFAILLRDRQRTLLSLEFKLYAIRNPTKRKRLSELHAAMCLRCCMTEIDQLLPELQHATDAQKRQRSAELAATLDGLALNLLFQPDSLDDKQVRRSLTLSVRDVMTQRYAPSETAL